MILCESVLLLLECQPGVLQSQSHYLCLSRHMIIMAPMNNNKQIFELLDNTDSQSGSEVQQLVMPPRKKRFRRRLRNNPSILHEDGEHGCRCSARTVSWSLFCLVLVCWLFTLTCLAAVLRRDLSRLDSDLQNSKY